MLMAGGAAEVLPVSLSKSLPPQRTYPRVFCFLVLAKWEQPALHLHGWM